MTSAPDESNGPAQWWDETGECELRQILHWRWDPIGVANVFPYAADEYDSQLPSVVDALRARASAADIARLLATIEDDRILGRAPLPPEGPSTACASWATPSSVGTKPPSGVGPSSGRFLGNCQV